MKTLTLTTALIATLAAPAFAAANPGRQPGGVSSPRSLPGPARTTSNQPPARIGRGLFCFEKKGGWRSATGRTAHLEPRR